MKKEVLFLFLFMVLIFAIFPSVNAAINATQEKQKIDLAYTCLKDKVNTSALCSSLSTEEKIFSVLAVNRCQSELINESSNTGECWPSGNCRLKTTSQAILALDDSGSNTDKAESWLLNQTKATTDLQWFLEIESAQPTTCTIGYSGLSFNVNIGSDKKITNNAGACLTLAENDYWLRIAPSCFDEEFEISCNKGFLTTLLFKKSASSTVHVSPESSSAAADGTTSEKVDSLCFVQNNICNYEGTLWASLVLDSLDQDRDVSSYLPYLLTLAEDNKVFIPDMFLYSITSNTDHRTSLLSKQKSKKYWSESGDKLYDTALALYPFQQETLQEKTNSKEYLLSIQDPNGCWENNIRNTAFILASIWPRSFSGSGGGSGGGGNIDGVGEETFSCEEAGYSCSTSSACSNADGETLSEYDCPSLDVCCTVQPAQPTCADLGGEACSSNEICLDGIPLSASDVVGQNCCTSGGTCELQTSDEEILSDCEANNGLCKSYGCGTDEETSTFYSCEFTGDSCCIAKTSGKKSLLWIWVLLVLIILVVIGIIFRNKLRMLWLRISKRSSGGSKPGPGFGSSPPSRPSGPSFPLFRPSPMMNRTPMRPPERRIMIPPSRPPQPSANAQQRPAPKAKSTAQKELDDVLKKLKEMSK